MKRAIILSIFLSALCNAGAQNISSQSILGATLDTHSMEYKADSIELNFTLDMSNFDINSNESAVLTPVIASGDNIETLPTIVLRGRSGAKSYRRAMTVGSAADEKMYGSLYKTPSQIIDYYGSNKKKIGNTLSYKYTIPYERWMAYSHVAIDGVVYSCCNSDAAGRLDVGKDLLSVDIPHIEDHSFVPQVNLIKPEKVAIKRRDIKHSSHIIFKVNSSVINHTLHNNQHELDLIDEMMRSVTSDEDYTITAINIVGYASPEGRYDANQKLSENRARAIQQLLVNKYSVGSNLYNVKFGGENWEDLVPMVEASDLKERNEIINIIENVSINDGREMKLINLAGGSAYKYMLKNYFPSLRKVIIDVEFNVDAYDLDRIREVIKTKPQNLSLEEMYRLSETYSMDSEEFLNIFLTAVEQHPNDQIALHNALVAEIDNGDIEGAAEFVARLDGDMASAETANALGVYYTFIGEYESARKLLTQAVDMGCEDASFNLEQMNIKIATEQKIEESKALHHKIYGDSAPLK